MDKQMNYKIRPLEEKDIHDMQNLFHTTVLNINIKDYTKEEVEDWASCGDDMEHWKEILFNNQFIGAFNEQGCLIGYSSMNKNGYLHSMFVHKDWQGKGIATLLLSEVEKIARQYKVKEITSEVSKTARPFFEHKGYVVECEQKQQANRLKLTNYKMKKVL
ncbi:MAG: GNAT family N-acetyltransferase [Candidatus Phocaeicola faecipullorum]|nr:GNAT family N-acetyltransferase [Candidatus Phocaeicola faecipullorum]